MDNLNRTSQRIMLLWALLCMSVTVLYGGDLVSSLTLSVPPKYPATLSEFPQHDIKIFTSTHTISKSGQGPPVPAFDIVITKMTKSNKSKSVIKW